MGGGEKGKKGDGGREKGEKEREGEGRGEGGGERGVCLSARDIPYLKVHTI